MVNLRPHYEKARRVLRSRARAQHSVRLSPVLPLTPPLAARFVTLPPLLAAEAGKKDCRAPRRNTSASNFFPFFSGRAPCRNEKASAERVSQSRQKRCSRSRRCCLSDDYLALTREPATNRTTNNFVSICALIRFGVNWFHAECYLVFF